MSETPILATKLFIPTMRSDLVLRQRLIDPLNAGGQHKLILVSAPAGYGKTTLVSSWLCQKQVSSTWLHWMKMTMIPSSLEAFAKIHEILGKRS